LKSSNIGGIIIYLFIYYFIGSGNVMVGYNSGGSCESCSNNTFLGTNTQFKLGQSAYNGSIALGSNAVINTNNQLMVMPTITSFNISGLTASTGTGEGTILEFDSSGNIIPLWEHTIA